MLDTSSNLKISIYVNFEDQDNEEITDAAILLMKGKQVIRGRLIGKNIDESDEELVEKILTEETDKEMFDPETLKLGVRNVDTSLKELVIEEIFGAMRSFKSVIMRIDGSEDGDDQFVIYNDNKNTLSNSNFFHELANFIEENDDRIFPTSLKDVFSSSTDINQIFNNYGYKDIMYVEDSCVSNAAFIGIAFDFSLGFR